MESPKVLLPHGIQGLEPDKAYTLHLIHSVHVVTSLCVHFVKHSVNPVRQTHSRLVVSRQKEQATAIQSDAPYCRINSFTACPSSSEPRP